MIKLHCYCNKTGETVGTFWIDASTNGLWVARHFCDGFDFSCEILEVLL